jgi:CheY-like chemotaxis protein
LSASVAAPPKSEAAPAPAPRREGKTTRKFQVLLVDDSMAFLEMISELFEDLAEQRWEIHTANAADKALAILQQSPIALVVLDIGMPLLDGVQLLGMINKRHPEVKKVVLTGGATESLRASCLANGAELFLEKPISPDGIKFVFNVLNDLLTWSHREGFSGTLRQVDLSDIIQIQCLCRNSCILELRNAEIQGEIFIEEGAIIHAAVGELTGEPAIRQLFTLTNGEFQLYPFRQPTERSVQGPWELLLLEAARARDEQKHPAAGTGTPLTPHNPPENQPAPKADEKPATPLPAPPNPANPPKQDSQIDTDFTKLGDDIIVVSTYEKDGKWHPKDKPDK